MGIVDRIKVLCAMKKISISDLEEVLGFSKGSIYKWDKSSPSFDKVIKVAKYFEVTLDYLAGLESGDNLLTSNFAARRGKEKESEVSQEVLDNVIRSVAEHLSKLSIDELVK